MQVIKMRMGTFFMTVIMPLDSNIFSFFEGNEDNGSTLDYRTILLYTVSNKLYSTPLS